MRALGEHPDARSALVATGVPAAQHAAYAEALAGLANVDVIRPRPQPQHVSARRTAREAGRALRTRARRTDLPDLGAHLRVQPGLRALPVVLWPAGPARTDHTAVRVGHRRAAAHEGLLRQHRRRRADDQAGLLAPAALRDRAPGRREVLHQRRAHHTRAGEVPRGQRLRRRPGLARRGHRRGQRLRAGSRLVRHRPHGAGEPARRRLPRRQDLGGLHQAEHRPARRVPGTRRPVRRHAAAHQAAAERPRRGRLGRTASAARPSSATCTTGSWRTATGC